MFSLTQFCDDYLPQYFVVKYTQQKIYPTFFDFKCEKNLYEKTTNLVTLIEKLLFSNPLQLIQKHFLFQLEDLKKISQNDQIEEAEQTKNILRKIMRLTQEFYREAFQLYVRLIFIYFHCKLSTQQPQIVEQYVKTVEKIQQQIVETYRDLKIRSMTEIDTFLPLEFMIYIIDSLFDLNPNQRFFDFVKKICQQCNFNEMSKEKVKDKIKSIEKKRLLRQIQKNRKLQYNLKEFYTKKQDKIIQESSNKTFNEIINLETPIKSDLLERDLIEIPQINQKKINFTLPSKILTQNKLTKKFDKYISTPLRKRTIYTNSKPYFAPKKSTLTNLASLKSLQNITKQNNQYLDIIQFTKSNSMRYLPSTKNEEDVNYLVDATPKPKKKMKLQKAILKKCLSQDIKSIQSINLFSN